MAFLRGAAAFLLVSIFVSALLFFSGVWSDEKLILQQFIMPSDAQATLVEPKAAGKRVAIIGAGSAGSSTAYYLRRFLANSTLSFENVSISIYDKHSYIGGRSITVDAYDDPSQPVELGASIFVEVNENLVKAAKEFGLVVTSDEESAKVEGPEPDELGIWDGGKFVFTMPRGKWWSLAKVIRHYGIVMPWRVKRLTDTTIGKFLQMYRPPFFPFTSLSDTVHDLGLVPATAATGLEFLETNGVTGPFRNELMQASTRVNYGQNLGLIHGLETMCCMAAEGAMSVVGGNWQIFREMVNASGAEIHLSTPVSAVSQLESGEWTVTSKADGASVAKTETFDTVVMAGPLQFSNIEITPELEKVPDEVPYVTLHVTLFASPRRLSPSYFGLKNDQLVPESVFTTLNEKEMKDEKILQGRGKDGLGSSSFFSISTLRAITRADPSFSHSETKYLYKVFSPEYFGDKQVLELLGAGEKEADDAIEWKYRHVWKSYPFEYPRVTFDEIKLASGLWYTASVESFISTMETSSLMGMNVAKLVVEEWEAGEKCAKEENIEAEFLENGELKMKAKL